MKTNDTTMATICREINKKRTEAIQKAIKCTNEGAIAYHNGYADGLRMAMDIIRMVTNNINPQTDQA